MSKTSNARRKGLAVLATSALVAGASLAGAGSAHAVADFKFKRLGGTDRYETASLVADEFAATNKTVILANGEPGNYADALSANTLAGELSAPILLTRKDKTPKFTLDQLKEDGVTDIYVVGGEGVVSAAQVSSLEGMGYKVTRVAGSDRFLTNAEVIKRNGTAKGATGLIATGFNFPDALAAGPISYQGHPLGLSATNNIEDAVVNALKAAGVTKVLIFGGESVVGPGVVAKLAANGITVEKRFAGADRSDTSQAAAEYALANLGFSNKHLGVASGYVQGFGADALAGGPLEGKEMAPMLVTRDVNNPDDVVDYMKDHANTLETGHLFGGTGAISTAAQTAMENAAKTAPASSTSLPELRSASIVGTVTTGQSTPTNPAGTTVRYTFDEAPVSGGGLGPDATKFHVYTNSGAPGSNGADIVSVSGNDVVVRFTGIATTAGAAALTVATVDEGAVKQTDGKTNIIGDAPLGTSSGGGTSTLPAGVTIAPDLISVGNFRQASAAGDTAIDFTFDEAARTTATPDFDLVQLDGTVLETIEPAAGDDTAGGGTVPGGNGTTTITVVYDGASASTPLLTAGDIARGVVAEDSVEEETNNETSPTTKDKNELQAADVSNNGNSTKPDLVSVALRPRATSDGVDQALFTFDQNVTAATPAQFFLYKVDGTKVAGTGTAAINSADARQVLVDFTDTATEDAVGGNITTGAVAPSNAPDEVGVANTTSNASQTAGKTSAPDLTGVKLSDQTNVFDTVVGVYATYTFDEVVATKTNGDYFLYLADGTKLTAVTCAIGPETGTADDNTVRCEFAAGGTPVNPSYAKAAVVGAVDDTAAVDAGGASSPEGAENTTGGTGTPTS